MIKVGRAINNITINGKEWLLNEKNELMLFRTVKDAIKFLKLNGYNSYSEEVLINTFLFEEV